MAKKITRTITFTRIKVASIDKTTREIVDLPDVVVEGKVDAEKVSKYTKDVVMGIEYDSGSYAMDISTFIEHAEKIEKKSK